MSTTTPLAKVPNEDFVKIHNAMKEAALRLAREKYLTRYAGQGGLIVRDLKPADLGLNTNDWTFNIANAGENTIVDYTVPDDTLILIYMVYNESTSPVTTEIKFGTGAGDIADVFIGDMYQFDIPAKILDDAVVYPPGKRAVIKAIATGANSDEKLGFVGFVVEPRGKTIQPPE